MVCIAVAALSAQDSSGREFSRYEEEVEQWHNKRLNGLKKEQGWLSLAALDWLKDGSNVLKNVGTITVRSDRLHLRLQNGLQGVRDGKIFTEGAVTADKDKIQIGKKTIAVIKRGGSYAVRTWESDHPARINFKGIERYPVSRRWIIPAAWEFYPKPKQVEIPTVIPGLIQHGIALGFATFSVNGTTVTLEPTLEEESGEYFFVFGDKTNGRETYGAGRFLYASAPKNGVILLDFNKSFNPPCVFSEFATCPVPSRNNILPVRIEAGEKNYKLQ